MNRLALFLLLSINPSWAFDNGQYQNVDPKIRDWYKSVRSPNGIPCCDIADGHSITWRPSQVSGYEFEVLIEENWIPVPPEAVIKGIPNPTGSAVVWYIKYNDMIHIRCFILGDVS